MHIREIQSKTILTKQNRGFLTDAATPFTHSLSWAVGCGFGKTYCGKFCYAQMLPNWLYNREEGEAWGDAVVIKANAPELLAAELEKSRSRADMRIFMSTVTDPYQPLERRYRLTRQCLEVFAGYDDLNLLLIQTRSPFVLDDAALIASIPYAWVSMTLETDVPGFIYGPNEATIRQRLEAVRVLVRAGVKTQIVASPCLPYSPKFADTLISTGAHRFVVDSFTEGDGTRGRRTANSEFAALADYNWRSSDPARDLYAQLQAQGAEVGWSAEGFAGIRAT